MFETPKAPTGYRVVWQSEPAITFDPATSDGSTTVLFDRMPAGGKIKIWAQLQKHSGGGSYATVGEAPQVETVVVPPVFKWTFEPGKGKGNVGKEVKVTITTVPAGVKPELLSYEWSYPESSNRMEYEKNASVIGFVPKSPSSAMRGTSSIGNEPSWRTCVWSSGRNSRETKSRTVSRARISSSESRSSRRRKSTKLSSEALSLPRPDGTGGSVSNTGLGLHRLGVPTRLVARIGDSPNQRL